MRLGSRAWIRTEFASAVLGPLLEPGQAQGPFDRVVLERLVETVVARGRVHEGHRAPGPLLFREDVLG